MTMYRNHSLHHLFAAAVLSSLLACGAAQTEPRGEVFCDSYEDAFMGQCRQNCEATTDGDSQEISKQCMSQCFADLKDDDTFGDSCDKRAKEL